LNIITRGMGTDHMLITQGYGYSIHVVNPDTGNEYLYGGVGPASKFSLQHLRNILDGIIETEKIVLGKDIVTLNVEVKFTGISPLVSAELSSITYSPHHVTIKVTN